ncbi:MAG: hypothetical protein ACREV5_02655 [Steroidobacter sp.]
MRSSVMVNPSLDVRPIYTIDALDRIVFVNPAWLAFTRPEGGKPLTLQHYMGHSVWDVLEGGQIRRLWEVLYGRVRAMGARVFVPMRADKPSERRLIDIELRPLADGSIQHICERVWSEARPAVALLDPSWPRDERTLRCCAWCKRIQVRIGAWEEIEQAQLTLAIEATETLPTLTHGVCVTCKQSLLKTFPARVA